MLSLFSTLFLMLFNLLQFWQWSTLTLNPENRDEEFNLFLFSLLILGLIFICLCVLVGIVITLLSLLLVFGLIAMGALSASALIGISTKSVTSGFRAFVIIFATLATTLAGGLSFWIMNKIVHWWSPSTAIVSGLAIGFVGGLLMGIVVASLIKKLSAYLKNRLGNS